MQNKVMFKGQFNRFLNNFKKFITKIDYTQFLLFRIISRYLSKEQNIKYQQLNAKIFISVPNQYEELTLSNKQNQLTNIITRLPLYRISKKQHKIILIVSKPQYKTLQMEKLQQPLIIKIQSLKHLKYIIAAIVKYELVMLNCQALLTI